MKNKPKKQRKLKVIILTLVIILIVGGVFGAYMYTNKKPICSPPYFEYKKGDCCLDKDNNFICDNDEEATKVQISNVEKLSGETIEDQAKEVATKFAIYWSKGNHEGLYDLFVSDKKKLKTKGEFVMIMTHEQVRKKSQIAVRLDEVEIISDTEAYAQYSGTVNAFAKNVNLPPVKMIYENGEWKVDAFGNVFGSSTSSQTCQLSAWLEGGYEQCRAKIKKLQATI